MTDHSSNNSGSSNTPKLIIPEGVTQPDKIDLRSNFSGGALFAELTQRTAHKVDEILRDMVGIVQSFRYKVPADVVPLTSVEDVQDSEVKTFRRSMGRMNLMTFEESPGAELQEHLAFLGGEGILDAANVRQLRGHIMNAFARNARGIETIVLGDLDEMAKNDPAQHFLDGSFLNNCVLSINGYDKVHVRHQLSAFREGREYKENVLQFRPR